MSPSLCRQLLYHQITFILVPQSIPRGTQSKQNVPLWIDKHYHSQSAADLRSQAKPLTTDLRSDYSAPNKQDTKISDPGPAVRGNFHQLHIQ